MNNLLRNFPNVMNGRVKTLLSKYQHQPLPQLEVSQGGHRKEGEQPIQHRNRDHIQGVWDQENGSTDKDVRDEGRQPGLPYIHNLLRDVAMVDVLLYVR